MVSLKNGGFEADWSEGASHRCLVFPGGKEREAGSVFTPPGWTTWFLHEPGTWDQPEVRDVHVLSDARRVRSGEKAMLFFTFFRNHDGGFLQQVEVEPGTRLALSAWAHAWSNTNFEHEDQGDWSEGAGRAVVAWSEGSRPHDTGDPQQDAKANFTFSIGIDPAGGLDPYADGVVWCSGWHIYNGFAGLGVEAVAEGETVTVFLRSRTLWKFKHNDAYWDDVSLRVVEDEPEPSTVLVLPQDGTREQLSEVLDVGYAQRRTFGFSHRDAGLLAHATGGTAVLYDVPEDERAGLEEYYRSRYPGAVLEWAETSGGDDEPPPPPCPAREVLSVHVQGNSSAAADYIQQVQPGVVKFVMGMERGQWVKSVSPETLVVYRQWIGHQGQYLEDPDPKRGARRYLETFLDSLHRNADHVDYVESLNETIATGDTYGIQRAVAFDAAFCECLADEGYPARPIVLTAGVGNPQHGDEVKLMLPAVRACVAAGGAVGGHTYTGCRVDGYRSMDDAWEHFAGRPLESWDPVFVSEGLYPDYIFTECGAIYCVNGHMPSSEAGWGYRETLGGDAGAYVEVLMRCRRKWMDWNEGHGNRVLGATVFTAGGGKDWRHFELKDSVLGPLADVITGRRVSLAEWIRRWKLGGADRRLAV